MRKSLHLLDELLFEWLNQQILAIDYAKCDE